MASKVIFLTATGANTWTVPNDWNVLSNRVEVFGAGGGGDALGGAGAGAAWAKSVNLNLTVGASINYTIGVSAVATAGGDTWFNAGSFPTSGQAVGARGGGAPTTITGGTGGPAGDGSGSAGNSYFTGSGSAGNSGGNGGSVASGNPGGGGGAGGPNGAGNSGSNGGVSAGGNGGQGDATSGGVGGTGSAGTGGTGGAGTEYTQTSDSATGGAGGGAGGGIVTGGLGGLYGAGGGGGLTTGGAGTQGFIVITYDPAGSPSRLNAQQASIVGQWSRALAHLFAVNPAIGVQVDNPPGLYGRQIILSTVLAAWIPSAPAPVQARPYTAPFQVADNPPFGQSHRQLDTSFWQQPFDRLPPVGERNPSAFEAAGTDFPGDVLAKPFVETPLVQPQRSRPLNPALFAAQVDDPPFGRRQPFIVIAPWIAPDPPPTVPVLVNPGIPGRSIDNPPGLRRETPQSAVFDPLPTLSGKLNPGLLTAQADNPPFGYRRPASWTWSDGVSPVTASSIDTAGSPSSVDDPPFAAHRTSLNIVPLVWRPPDPLPTLRGKLAPSITAVAVNNPPFIGALTVFVRAIDLLPTLRSKLSPSITAVPSPDNPSIVDWIVRARRRGRR